MLLSIIRCIELHARQGIVLGHRDHSMKFDFNQMVPLSIYSNIQAVLRILPVCPVTTATVERANSSLEFVKTVLRSTMGDSYANEHPTACCFNILLL